MLLLTESIAKTFAQPQYQWLDCRQPYFGAKGGGKWLFPDKGDTCLNYVFELYDPRFPNGTLVGKCNLYVNHHSMLNSPDAYEAQCLIHLMQHKDELPCGNTLPDVFAIHTLVPVFCNGLGHLPMRSSSYQTHPYCDVIFVRSYWGDLRTLTSTMGKQMPLTAWKYILFEVAYTLHVLQESFGFQHHDLHDDNILIDRLQEPTCRTFNVQSKQFRFEQLHFSVVLWDFETAVCFSDQLKHQKRRGRRDTSIPMIKVPTSLQSNDNRGPTDSKPMRLLRFYDLHQFLMHILESESLPREIDTFIRNLYPDELIPDFEEVRLQREAKHDDDEDGEDGEDEASNFSDGEEDDEQPQVDDATAIFWDGLQVMLKSMITCNELKNQQMQMSIKTQQYNDVFWQTIVGVFDSLADKPQFLRDVHQLLFILDAHNVESTFTLREACRKFLMQFTSDVVEASDESNVSDIVRRLTCNTCTFFTPEITEPLRNLLNMQEKMDCIGETVEEATNDKEEEDVEEVDEEEESESESAIEESNFSRFYQPDSDFQQFVVSDSTKETIQQDLERLTCRFQYYPPNEKNTLTYVKLLSHTWTKYGPKLITPKEFLLHPFFSEFQV